MISLNDLVGYDNMKIYQNDEWFCFSLESILLPCFVTLNKRDKNILDLCSGNAPIPLVLSTKTNAKIYGIELQKDIYELGLNSIKYNKLEDRISFINDNVLNLREYFNNDYFDLITVNPPYFKIKEDSITNKDIHKTIARHEKDLELKDILNISKILLKDNGRIAIVHRTERFIEILELLKQYGFMPKKIQFIYPNTKKESKLFMIEATKNGKDSLKLMPPLYIHNEDGSYQNDVLKMFEKGD